jgi:hypothetical protein
VWTAFAVTPDKRYGGALASILAVMAEAHWQAVIDYS